MNSRHIAMARRNFRLAFLSGAVLVALGATATASNAAQRVDRSAAQAQLRADMQYCNSGQSGQPRALCQHEARQAYNEALRGTLDVPVMQSGTRSTTGVATGTGQGGSGSQGMTTGAGTGSRTGSASSGNSGSTADPGQAGTAVGPNSGAPGGTGSTGR
jgi:hypothetical protein